MAKDETPSLAVDKKLIGKQVRSGDTTVVPVGRIKGRLVHKSSENGHFSAFVGSLSPEALEVTRKKKVHQISLQSRSNAILRGYTLAAVAVIVATVGVRILTPRLVKKLLHV